jgi:Domain of unknown function (DUF4340)
MKSKTLGIVIAVAGLSIVGAYFALSKGTRTVEFEPGAVFFGDLEAKAGSIDRIELERNGRKLEVVREGGVWKLASSEGYPARFEEVKGLVAGLTNLRGDQKMTARKERHAELGLSWPDDSGKASRIQLFSGSDAVLDAVVGEERANPRSQFIRRGNEDQTWRVLGSVLVDIEPRRWTEAELLAIPEGEVRGVKFNGLQIAGEEGAGGKVDYKVIDGSPMVAPTEFDWTPTRRTTALRVLPSWLSRLELDDVRKAKGGAPDPAVSAEFDMVRGTLKVNGVREGEDVWISFEATAKDGAPSAAEINAKKKYPGDPYVPDWNEFAAKHAGWEYKLPGWKLTALQEMAKIPAESEKPADPNAPTVIPSAG